MTQSPNKPNSRPNTHQSSQNQPSRNNPQKQGNVKDDAEKSDDIVTAMVKKIDGFNGLKEYKIRDLVEDTEKLGKKLVEKGLKTNQIRKFLDAVNRFKMEYAKINVQPKEKPEILSLRLEEKRDELHILRYQLAYAAARQKKEKDPGQKKEKDPGQKKEKDPGPVEPLKKVLEAAIKQVRNENKEDFARDFTRLVQLIESIVAYHKAAGGKDQ